MKARLKIDFVYLKLEKDEYTGLCSNVENIIQEGTLFEIKRYSRDISFDNGICINSGITLRNINDGKTLTVSLDEYRVLFEEIK